MERRPEEMRPAEMRYSFSSLESLASKGPPTMRGTDTMLPQDVCDADDMSTPKLALTNGRSKC